MNFGTHAFIQEVTLVLLSFVLPISACAAVVWHRNRASR
jgi:hypothetical protein